MRKLTRAALTCKCQGLVQQEDPAGQRPRHPQDRLRPSQIPDSAREPRHLPVSGVEGSSVTTGISGPGDRGRPTTGSTMITWSRMTNWCCIRRKCFLRSSFIYEFVATAPCPEVGRQVRLPRRQVPITGRQATETLANPAGITLGLKTLHVADKRAVLRVRQGNHSEFSNGQITADIISGHRLPRRRRSAVKAINRIPESGCVLRQNPYRLIRSDIAGSNERTKRSFTYAVLLDALAGRYMADRGACRGYSIVDGPADRH